MQVRLLFRRESSLEYWFLKYVGEIRVMYVSLQMCGWFCIHIIWNRRDDSLLSLPTGWIYLSPQHQ